MSATGRTGLSFKVTKQSQTSEVFTIGNQCEMVPVSLTTDQTSAAGRSMVRWVRRVAIRDSVSSGGAFRGGAAQLTGTASVGQVRQGDPVGCRRRADRQRSRRPDAAQVATSPPAIPDPATTASPPGSRGALTRGRAHRQGCRGSDTSRSGGAPARPHLIPSALAGRSRLDNLQPGNPVTGYPESSTVNEVAPSGGGCQPLVRGAPHDPCRIGAR